MKGFIRLLPGTVVLNQDTDNPLSGTVIDTSDNTVDGWASVHWVDGRTTHEDLSDLILTGQLKFEVIR